MLLANGADYMDSLPVLKPVVSYKGKRIDNIVENPATAPMFGRPQ